MNAAHARHRDLRERMFCEVLARLAPLGGMYTPAELAERADMIVDAGIERLYPSSAMPRPVLPL